MATWDWQVAAATATVGGTFALAFFFARRRHSQACHSKSEPESCEVGTSKSTRSDSEISGKIATRKNTSSTDDTSGEGSPHTSQRSPTLPTIPHRNFDDRYKVTKELGEGEYGVVYECIDKKRMQIVAAKRMENIFRRDSKLVDCRRVLRELAILTSLESDCIVKVEDIVIGGDLLTFQAVDVVLELCDRDMQTMIYGVDKLEADVVSLLLYNLLGGLKYIHSAGVYHRDLKPANCLVNEDCSVKICDFGLSCVHGGMYRVHHAGREEPDHCAHVLTRKKSHEVSRHYRAPELILLQEYSELVDVWSAGCIFADLLQLQEKTIRKQHRRAIFGGGCCDSTGLGRTSSLDRGTSLDVDQLRQIFAIVGTPEDKDIAMLTESAQTVIRNLGQWKGSSAESRYPTVSDDSKDLLRKMLQFIPRSRCSVEDALAHPLLAPIRDPSDELTADEFIDLGFDDESRMDEFELRQHFGEVLQSFQDSFN